jgi:hypothetical protein
MVVPNDVRNSAAWKRLRKEAIKVWGATCHICRQPIDLTIKRGPDCYALDHLDPVSVYGHELPPVERVRPSHFGCNSSKKAKPRVRRQSRRW